MVDAYLTEKNLYEYEYNMKRRPHVVLLGAGASCAAIPNGDRNGKKISAMSGFIEKLGLSGILGKVAIHTNSDNLEDIYMELDERCKIEPNCMEVKQELEKVIREYMSDYKLPSNPTVYDYLIMGLTSKDLIATFNWDPLLIQAYARAMAYTTNLPQLAFLHGNVAVGYCFEDNVMGNVGIPCRCGEPLAPTKLLFPIKNKDYASDTAISKSWKSLSNALEVAYMVTIFGYSAPKSDVEAIEMLKKAWGAVKDRNFEEIEIVDLRNENEVIESWDDFIHTHHYSYHSNFFTTTIGRCPRRSCEATFDRLMMNHWLKPDKGFKPDMNFSDIDKLTCDLIIDEENKKGTKSLLLDPYA
ncbi:MAG: hypothetical protein LKE46_09665 [Clostridium sp.]|jgi:hypothetical protein|uniref:hypothetical protein n=1 Tax=Clostridium sp. TaxID=1506 RepID=UPI0025B91950|nr:hypothetical protein [Clostridium sp.]MCH3964530.1 hypothetical protein [Clostridium sp.]MCI1715001.1 hypothetical protein [Clostridium sp.]MCI1799263.1 hypothetical protein [Clostridium sp.]MCI1813184.1 hypothetical protein [Clostridium sp.]MCI1870075.1 hypothetical protein [Clostridium sp.]